MSRKKEKILIKKPWQIDGIRKSSQLAAATLLEVEKHIKPGISTEYINTIASEYINDNNGKCACLGYRNFPKEICTSINDVVCHGIPSKEMLKDGDIINVDVTTIVDGFFGDTSKTFLVGDVSAKARELVEVTDKCLHLGIEQVKPGNTFDLIAQAITSHAVKLGYGVVFDFVGHGTGIRFHEPPQIYHYYDEELFTGTQPTMKPGMIFTIEPMINIGYPESVILEDGWTATTADGSLSAQFEHTVLVTKTGNEILTKI